MNQVKRKSEKVMLLCLVVFMFVGTHSTGKKKDTKVAKKESGKIVLTISGIKKINRRLFIALFNNKKEFSAKKKAKTVSRVIVTPKNKVCVHIFKDIPYGTYAVKMFYDINGNGKLDLGWFSIPKEPYGFSNNSLRPVFRKAKFVLNKPSVSLKIKLR